LIILFEEEDIMKIRKLYLFTLLILFGMKGFAEQVSFTMEAPQVVELGEQFRLSFSVNVKGQNLKLPELSDFEVLMGPSTSTSSSFSIVNGVSSQSVNYGYLFVLRAKKVGKFTISPASINVNGSQYTSNSLTIEVVKGSAKPSGGGNDEPAAKVGNVPKSDLFVRVILDRRNVYKGDHILATIKIYSKVNLNGFEDISLPNYEGFWAQDIELPQQISLQRETLNGEIYNVGTLKKTILFPQQTGNITIGSVKIDCIVQQRVRRSSSFFDDFFDSFANVKATVVSDPVNVSVNPLPAPPVNFSGAVGRFDLRSSITTASVKENDPITLKLDVSGKGNIKLINPPKMQLPPDFEVYDPKTTSNFNATTEGVNGSISFEYLFLPRNAGDYTIAPIDFIYFDPSAGKYVTKSTQEFKIHVARGAGSRASMNISSKEDVKMLGNDIRFLKQGDIQLRPKGYIFFGSLSFYLLYLGGIAALLALYFFNQKRIQENANIARLKNKKANKVALKRLKEANLYLKKGSTEKFYESVTRAFWGYLSDKLTIPVAELTRERASAALEQRKASAEVISGFIQILDTCEYARFAPGEGSAKMQELYDEATDVMSRMEKEIK
jgi:hypothetical protein